MRGWIVAAALAAALSGCGSSTPAQPIGFLEPSGVAVFQGLTSKYADVHPYVAVLNAGRSDLTLLDAWDDSPVLAPVVVKSLAVPVPVVRPSMMVSSTLADGTDTAPTPDLLVIAGPGSTVLQLVATWSATPEVVDAAAVDLAAVAPGAQILALAAVPPLDPATGARVAGRARVVASLTGGNLAVVDYQRATDGTDAIAPVGSSVVLQPLLAVGLGTPFDAVSLAVNVALPESQRTHLYAASPDPVGRNPDGSPTQGVADLDMTTAPGSWVEAGIDARAPTILVAAARLRERASASAADDATAFTSNPIGVVDRVYAALDPARCGPADRVPCGIAVLDPATHRMAPDYTKSGIPMPYLAPIHVPGVPLTMSISLPPRNPPSADEPQYGTSTAVGLPLAKIAPPSGVRGTTAVMAVGSSDGRVYFVDLGRWSIPNTGSILISSGRTLVSSAGANTISPTYTGGSTRQLGLWRTSATGVDTILKTGLEAAITVTPGFTTSETWTVSYQGTLPGLELRRGQTGLTAGGATRVALQVPTPTTGGGQTLTQVVRVTDPALGLHAGDVVRLLATKLGVPACVDPTPEAFGGEAAAEATVADILPPDAVLYPGGAIVLAPTLADPRYDPALPVDADHPQVGYDWPACIAALGAAGVTGVPVEIRASDFVVVGSSTGYAGRAIVQYAAPGTPSYALQYANEDDLQKLCPDPAACTDLSCRTDCERLVLARKARRLYHLSDSCAADLSGECARLWPGNQFPQQAGPVVAFSVGYVGDPQDNGTVPTDPKLRNLLRAGLKITLVTTSGIAPTVFRPGTGSGSASSYPVAAVTYDRSVVPGKEGDGYRFYVPFVDSFVLDFSPSQAAASGKILR